jgi:hypothetical protein
MDHGIAETGNDFSSDSGKEKENELVTTASFRPGFTDAQDFVDPEVLNESETTHKGEFGTRRDLVSLSSCRLLINCTS